MRTSRSIRPGALIGSVAIVLSMAGPSTVQGETIPDGASSVPSPASVEEGPSASPVTFTRDIAPIVFEKCAACHRPGEAGPFALLTYEDVRRRARLIRDVTEERYMPPWHAAHGFGEFRGERRLTDEQIDLIGRWVDAGMPEGDAADLPPAPEFPEGWQLGTPDVMLTMDESFEVPADGRDIYRYFVLPLNLPEDKWIKAIEVRPQSRSVVHHVLFFASEAGKAQALDSRDPKPGFSGKDFQAVADLGGWAVGTNPQFFPDDLAIPLPKNTDLVLQTHFHPSGKEESEKTRVGIFFADKPPPSRLFAFQIPPAYGSMAGIDIPPGQAEFVIEDSFVLPADVELVNVWGHAHQLCTEMKGEAFLPDGSRQPILHIPDWDFNWQTIYQYRDRVRLPAGTRIDVRIAYDNSEKNPDNPFSPPKRVRWGEQSFDEMGSLIFQAVAVDEAQGDVLAKGFHLQHRRAFLEATARRLGPDGYRDALVRIRSADTDGDGRIAKNDIDGEWRDLVFRNLDHDDNEVIEPEEIERALEVEQELFGG